MKPPPRPAIPSPLFADLVESAKMYLSAGPEFYRTIDEMGMPDESLSDAEMAALEKGMKQICRFKGIAPEKPFTDLDIDGFAVLTGTMHLALERQVLAGKVGPSHFLDEMHMVHAITGEPIVLYNLVPTPSARRKAAATKKGRKKS
jgi:hypothetical protein